MVNNFFLLFTAHFDRDRGLDYGRLSINSLDKGTINIWKAASSYATKQKQYGESFHERGGMLPPQYRVPKLKNWSVLTKPIPLDLIKGVEGNFYKLSPYEVTTDRGGVRSDFGIHKDANAPGSLGCIVMSPDRFMNFELAMAYFRKHDIKQLPLLVQYS